MVANGFESEPWARSGGSTTAGMGRLLAYSSAPPGVTRPTDLRVYASTPSADSFVHVAVGGISIPNRYSSAMAESYVARATQVTDVQIPASTTSLRRHLLCIRVTDPQYGGQVPGDGKYVYPVLVSDVADSVWRAEQVSSLLNVPAYAIARIDMPAGISNVQQSYIREARELSMPRYGVYNKLIKFPATEADVLVSNTSWFNWPNLLADDVAIPAWCNWIDAEIELLGFKANAAADVDTRVNIGNGSMIGPTFRWDYNGARNTAVGTVETFQHLSALSMAVPSGIRGTVQTMRLNAMRVFTQNTGRVWTDQEGQLRIRCEFLEKPAQS